MLPEWKKLYTVHNEKLDSQHKKMFDLAHKVYSLDAETTTKESMRELLKEFYSYMQEHFKQEESFMASFKYPKLEAHKKQHEAIIDEMNTIVKTSLSFKQMRASIQRSVQIWLVDYIMEHDMQYRVWHQEHKESGSKEAK